MNAPHSIATPGVARYAQLSALFRNRIECGDWPVGQQIPTLEQLVAQFGVARATVRQALHSLEADGLLARYRAKGTFVLKRSHAPQPVRLATAWDALSEAHEGVAIDVLENRASPRPSVVLDDGQQFADGYRYLKRLHRREGVPYLLGEVHVDKRIYRAISPAKLRSATMLRAIKEQDVVPIHSAHQTFTVAAADVEIASLLAMPLNGPVAIVDRRAFDPSRCLVYRSRGVYRGDHVRLEIALK